MKPDGYVTSLDTHASSVWRHLNIPGRSYLPDVFNGTETPNMAEYRSYSYNSAGPSHKQLAGSMQRTLTRNSQQTHHSVANSTVSWVQDQEKPPGRTTLHPPSIDTPPAVQRPRPLPNPHPQVAIQRLLHVVNVPDTPRRENEEHNDTKLDGRRIEFGSQTKGLEDGNSAEIFSTPSAGFIRPSKKKPFVGGFVKRIRRLPKTMFGYGAGTGGSDKNKLQRSGTLLTDATSTSATGTTGNTLPAYSSNPPTPSAIPGRSGLRVQYTPDIIVAEPTEPPIPESPPPDVVRLSSNRVSVPSDNFANEEHGRLASGPHVLSRKPVNDFSYGSRADRATVMLYQNPNSQYYENDQVAPRPPLPDVSRQLSNRPALSYIADPPPLQPVRSSSFHSSHTVVLPPLEIPTRVPTPGPNGPRVSYASQVLPRRTTPQSLIPSSHLLPSLPTQLELQTVPPSFLQQANPPPQPTEDVQSPVTAHPKHTADYRKMTTSPSPTSHNTFATGSSYYDPSFSSQLSPVERFFTTLYRMPWISHNRVTVDYLPGAGASVRRKRKMRPIASWYRSVMSRSSRNSGTIDALSNGTANSPRSNLRASLAMILGSPSSRRSSDRHRSRRHRSHDDSKDSHSRHHHSSHRQHRRPHHSYTNTERRTATSMDSAEKDGYTRTEPSHLIPSMYPYQYPPYPYPSFPGFPVHAPVPAIRDEQLSQIQSKERRKAASPRGPRAVPQQSTMFYAPAPGYASYQPMIAPHPPQVYFLQSPISPTYGGVASVPPALVPGGVHENGHAHGAQPGGGQAQQRVQPAVVASGQGSASGQSVPGAFST